MSYYSALEPLAKKTTDMFAKILASVPYQSVFERGQLFGLFMYILRTSSKVNEFYAGIMSKRSGNPASDNFLDVQQLDYLNEFYKDFDYERQDFQDKWSPIANPRTPERWDTPDAWSKQEVNASGFGKSAAKVLLASHALMQGITSVPKLRDRWTVWWAGLYGFFKAMWDFIEAMVKLTKKGFDVIKFLFGWKGIVLGGASLGAYYLWKKGV